MTISPDQFGYPVRHKRKVPFRPEVALTDEVAAGNRDILRLESELEGFILTTRDHLDLISEAFTSNIHLSTKLEGNPLTREQVGRVTGGVIQSGSFRDATDFPTQEVINHVAAYLSPELAPPWDVGDVCDIHALLMGGDRRAAPGKLRTKRAAVTSTSGEELFIPAPPEHVGAELESLLEWLNTAGKGSYPVIAGAIFFHEFESIHPFGDGNGRCGRTLFHLYLQFNGLPNSRLCLIERSVVGDAERYYDLLAGTDFTGDYGNLVEHFTGAVHDSYVDAVERFRKRDLLSGDLDGISRRLLATARRHRFWFDLETARAWLGDVSDFRLRSRLNGLVEMGALAEKGATRGKRYRFTDPLERVMEGLRDHMM
jgi:Fic family protein